jgi:xylulokinase
MCGKYLQCVNTDVGFIQPARQMRFFVEKPFLDDSMESYIITLDLGTTNIKSGIYDSSLHEVSVQSVTVSYASENRWVEFDAEEYWNCCKNAMRSVIRESEILRGEICGISLTGQAESLVFLDRNNRVLRRAISWMDARSLEECSYLKERFDIKKGYETTGQPDIIPTWPVTKILWLKTHAPDIFENVGTYMLIKDYILYMLTGSMRAEYTVYNFSYYLDIHRKCYWQDMLDAIGVKKSQLPELVEPGSCAGKIEGEVAAELGLKPHVTVNTGALDHFAAMIGTGNVREGIVTETTGTVLAIATLVKKPVISEYKIPCHYGALKNTYVLLPVCESGGISMEWFKNEFCADITYGELNSEIEKSLGRGSEIIFLPYLTGTNSPEYDVHARGVFYGLRVQHKRADLGRAVMEGVAYLLKKNLDLLERMGVRADRLISVGGGSKSSVWNQIKADITKKRILIPDSEEAASLGAAMLAAVEHGFYDSVEDAVDAHVHMKKTYAPSEKLDYRAGYKTFLDIYQRLMPLFRDEKV